MEESEVCSLPGGLASVRKQFETQETATSHNVTQFHFHHRAVQVEHSIYVHQAKSMREMTVVFRAERASVCTLTFGSASVSLHGELCK